MNRTILRTAAALLMSALLCMTLWGCAKEEEKINNRPTPLPVLPEGVRRVETDTDAMKKLAVDALNSLESVNIESEKGFTIASSADLAYVPDHLDSHYNMALNQRNMMFEKKYSTKLVQFTEDADAMPDAAFLNYLSGIHYADLFSIEQRELGRYAARGILSKTSTLAGADFTLPYYDSTSMEEASYRHNGYGIYGEFNRDISEYYCLYVNRDIMTAAGLEMPYNKVIDGTWTWDELVAMTKACAAAVPDRAVMAVKEPSLMLSAAYKSQGGSFLDAGTGKNAALSYGNQTGADVIADLTQMCSYGRALYDMSATTGKAQSDFMQGASLFYIGKVKEMATITTMKNDWCILPLPKSSPEDETYSVYADGEHAVICVYAGANNKDLTEAINGLYAASYGGYLTQGYYSHLIDTSIRDCYALDMMDYICGVKGGSLNIDLTDLYGEEYPEVYTYTRDALLGALYDPSLDAYGISAAVSDKWSAYFSTHMPR